jgi:predicted Zn-dependent protease
MSFKWKMFWAAALALVVLFQACGMHSWEELLVSTAHEKKMGREFDSLVQRGDKSVMNSRESIFKPANDAQEALWEYYQARAKEVVNKISKKDLEALLPSGNDCNKTKCTKDNFFEFKIINSETVNAFAVPGGYVYFYTAILKNFQSESELVSVLSHEIGHVVRHHSREAIVKEIGASAIIDLLLGDGMGATLASLGTKVWLLNGSQKNESEADVSAFEYTNALGISSKGLSDFFGRGYKLNADGKCQNPKQESSVLDWLSTHPPSCERIEKNLDRIANEGKGQEGFDIDKNTYKGKNFKQLVSAAGF